MNEQHLLRPESGSWLFVVRGGSWVVDAGAFALWPTHEAKKRDVTGWRSHFGRNYLGTSAPPARPPRPPCGPCRPLEARMPECQNEVFKNNNNIYRFRNTTQRTVGTRNMTMRTTTATAAAAAILAALLAHGGSTAAAIELIGSKHVIGYYASWQWYDRDKLASPASLDYTKVTRVSPHLITALLLVYSTQSILSAASPAVRPNLRMLMLLRRPPPPSLLLLLVLVASPRRHPGQLRVLPARRRRQRLGYRRVGGSRGPIRGHRLHDGIESGHGGVRGTGGVAGLQMPPHGSGGDGLRVQAGRRDDGTDTRRPRGGEGDISQHRRMDA